jgi:hypothetical protein
MELAVRRECERAMGRRSDTPRREGLDSDIARGGADARRATNVPLG